MPARRVPPEDRPTLDERACASLLHDHLALVGCAGIAVGREQKCLATGQELRPTVRGLTRPLVECRCRRWFAAGGPYSVERTIGTRRKHNRAVLAPGAAPSFLHRTDGCDRSAAQGELHQAAVGKESH